jgi:hypothetical protein
MRFPLLPARKSVVTLLNAPHIDFLACLVSLQCQVLKVGAYRPVFIIQTGMGFVPCVADNHTRGDKVTGADAMAEV